jgi:hypothetical protein
MTAALLRQVSRGFFILGCCISCLAQRSFAQDWQQLSSDHFNLYFVSADDKFARAVLDKSEVYYAQIASDLGYARYSEFWTWANKVKIYIYPDQASFMEATGEPEWSQGMADYLKKEIIGYFGSKGFEDSILPHEMAHLIFRDFVGFKGEVPLWLDEGVAQWHEKVRREEVRRMTKGQYEKDSLLSIKDMMKLDIRNIKYKDTVYIRPIKTKSGERGVLFLSGDSLISTYYLQAVSLVDFLILEYGTDTFTHFCRQLRDGKSLEEALGFAYPAFIRNLDDLERVWKNYIEEKT